jgi:hypothetical protein
VSISQLFQQILELFAIQPKKVYKKILNHEIKDEITRGTTLVAKMPAYGC